MNKLTTSKRIWSVFLTLAMVITMSVTALPSYAAGEGDGDTPAASAGSGTAVVHYEPSMSPVDASKSHYALDTTFKIYRIAGYGRYTQEDADNNRIPKGYKVGDSYFVREEGVPDAGNLLIRKDDYTGADAEADWTAAWQASAKAFAEAMKDKEPLDTQTCNASTGDATFTGLADGLYLVVGPEAKQKYMDETTHVSKYITVDPSFVQVLNKNGKIIIKYVEEPFIKEYVLTKIWDVPEKYEAIIPASLDVQLYYRNTDYAEDTEEGKWKEWKVVTLNKDNDWTFDWTSKDLNYDYDWEELLTDEDKLNFLFGDELITVEYGTTDDQGNPVKDNKKYVKITNKYEKRQLELTKILDNFLVNGDNAATFAFEIRGYTGTGDDEKLVYTSSAGINFAKNSTGSLTNVVDNIPVNLTRLEVEEVYSGNYQVTDSKKKVQNAVLVDRGEGKAPVYTVTFENKFSGDTTISGGIVNTYTNENGNIVLKNKDYGKTPQPLGPAQ